MVGEEECDRTGVPAPVLYNQNIAKRPYISAGPFLNMAGEEPYSNVRRTPRGSTSVSKLCLKLKRQKPAKQQAFLKWSVKRNSIGLAFQPPLSTTKTLQKGPTFLQGLFLIWPVKSHILTSGEPHEVQHQ
ncbi:hypothetical protein D8T38_09535 [Vibrio vulnificus]|nr:hypothetical protein D8T38_09535 [Vibrio vulnificus]